METIILNGYIPTFTLEGINSLGELSGPASSVKELLIDDIMDRDLDDLIFDDSKNENILDIVSGKSEIADDIDNEEFTENVFEKIRGVVIDHINEGKDLSIRFYSYYECGELQGYDFVLIDEEIDLEKILNAVEKDIIEEREQKEL